MPSYPAKATTTSVSPNNTSQHHHPQTVSGQTSMTSSVRSSPHMNTNDADLNLKGGGRNGSEQRSTARQRNGAGAATATSNATTSNQRGAAPSGGRGGNNAESRLLATNAESAAHKMQQQQKDGKMIAATKRDKDGKRAGTVSLLIVLGVQILIVLASFAAIIALTYVMTDNSVTALVRDAVDMDLSYAKESLLAPLTRLQTDIFSARAHYELNSQVTGVEACNEATRDFSASGSVLRNGLVISQQNELFSYILFTMRSKLYTRPGTSDYLQSTCAILNGDIMFANNLTLRMAMTPTKGRLYAPQIQDLVTTNANAFEIPFEDPSTLTEAMLYTDMHWSSFYQKPESEAISGGSLYLAIFVPMVLGRRAGPGQPVTSTFVPEYNSSSVIDPSNIQNPQLEVLTTVTIGANVDSFHRILVSTVSAKGAGASAALYDMRKGKLMASSLQQLPYIDGAMELLTAGHSGVPALDEAYAVAKPTTVTTAKTGIHIADGDVIACIRIQMPTGLDLAVVTRTPKSFYFSDVDALTTNLLAIGIVIALVTVLICVFIGVAIRMPIGSLLVGMNLASRMKNDRVVPTTSFLSDIDALCHAFDLMNGKLLVARDYMPQALLVDTTTSSSSSDSEGDHDNEGRKDTARHTNNNSTSHGHNISESDGLSKNDGGANNIVVVGRRRARRANSAHMSHSTGSTAHTNERVGGGGRDELLAGGLTARRVTVVSINARGFHKRATSGAGVTALGNELAACISALCVRQRGVVDAFHGDHFVLSFNATKANAQGPAKAVRCAMDLVQEGAGLASSPSSALYQLLYSIGIATGKAYVGHLGATGMKRLSIVGKVYARSLALERVCSRFNETNVSAAAAAAASNGSDEDIVEENVMVDAASTPSSSAAAAATKAVQILVDSYVASEVQHGYLLQVLGGLVAGSAPNVAMEALAVGSNSGGGKMKGASSGATAEDLIRQLALEGKTLLATGLLQPPAAASVFSSPVVLMSAGGYASSSGTDTKNRSASLANNNNTVVINASSSSSPAHALLPTPPISDFVYNIRGESMAGVNAQQTQQYLLPANDQDEWLYEVNKAKAADALLAAVNKHVTNYVEGLRGANGGDTNTNTNTNHCGGSIAEARHALLAALRGVMEEAVVAEMGRSHSTAVDGATSVPVEVRRQLALQAVLGKGNNQGAFSDCAHGKVAYLYAMGIATGAFDGLLYTH